MKIYVGQTRSRKLIKELSALGFGECTQPREYPPRRVPWFADNGPFGAWRAGRSFDGEAFAGYVDQLGGAPVAPDFLVAPDVVAGGGASLAMSCAWAPRLAGRAPLAFVVQDGMAPEEVVMALGPFRGPLRRRVTPVEATNRSIVGRAGACPRPPGARRTRRHAASRGVGQEDRRRLHRLVLAALERRESSGVLRGDRRPAARDFMIT